MLTLSELLEIEDNFQPVATVKVRKFRDSGSKFYKVPLKNLNRNYNNYRKISNDLL